MIHSVAPQRSGDPTTPSAADPPHPTRDDTPPGPISWDLEVPPDAPDVAPGPAAGDNDHPPAGWDGVPAPGWATAKQADAVMPGNPDRTAQVDGPTPMGSVPAVPVVVSRRPSPYLESEDDDREQVAPRLAAAVLSLGPIGRRRSLMLAAVIAVVTMGLYPIFWTRRANREMSQFDPRMSVRPGRSAGALALAVALPLVVALAEVVRVAGDRLGYVADIPVSHEISRWLLLAPALTPLLVILLPFSLIAASMTLERVRVVEDRAGVDPEHQVRPSARVWWAGLPVVGLAVLVVMGQRRLNRVWASCA